MSFVFDAFKTPINSLLWLHVEADQEDGHLGDLPPAQHVEAGTEARDPPVTAEQSGGACPKKVGATEISYVAMAR